ncbi:MAG TPA: helix-turn-helix domain-containing protein, partial [Chloroflexota bacterium]
MVTYQPSAFGAMLKHHRKAAGLTQEELAEAARLSARAISDLERGVRRTPYRDTVQQLADALALSAEDRASLSAAARPGAQSATEPPTERQDRAESIRTILIADIRDYTRFTAEHGDEAAARLTSRFAAIAADGVAGYDGRLVEAGGDEVVAVFSSARQALRAAIGLQERFAAQTDADPTTPLSVGIGLDAGEVVPVGDGYRGGALNLAARLCALAGPNEILASDGVVHLARRVEGVATIDRGAVQLKGLQEPMRVIQIAPEGQLPEDLPPLQPALAGRRTSLPDEPTPFIGREREIREVRALLGQPHTRLVTLLGPGGTGKTRLATRVGSSLLDDFRDGVVFVSLAPLVDPALVPSAIAGVLGLKEEASSALTGTLFRHLQDKQLLLILDNFEHVLAAAPVVAELLDVCRQLHVLSTSRIPLHLSWEQEYPVPPLAIPDPRQIAAPEQLAQYE